MSKISVNKLANPRYHVKVEAGDAYLIPGDMHFPIHDPDAVAAMQVFWDKYYKKSRRGTLLQGDTIDSHSISRHPKKPARLAAFPRLIDEVATARPFLTWAGAQALGCTVIPGNHEDWLQDLIDCNPGLCGAPGMDFPTLTGLTDIDGLDFVPYGTWVRLGDLVSVCHGDPKDFPKKPNLVVNKYPEQFTLFGHTHRAAVTYKTVYSSNGEPGTVGAMNVGHLGLIPEYTSDPDWQQAFAVVEFFGDRGNGKPFFRANLHHIVRDRKGTCHVA